MANSIKAHRESQIFCGEQDGDSGEVKVATVENYNMVNLRKGFLSFEHK